MISIISMSFGSVFLIFFNSFFTSFAILTVLAPDCFIIDIRTPLSPFIFWSTVLFLIPSFTVAMSRTYIVLFIKLPTAMFLIISLSLNSPSIRIE